MWGRGSRGGREEEAFVQEAARDADRREEVLSSGHDDVLRRDLIGALRRQVSEDREQLPVPREEGVLRRVNLPPDRQGLRNSGWRPGGHGDGWSRLQIRGRGRQRAEVRSGRPVGYGELRPQ